jgi:MYXO-CTERM domain-containing protein
MRKTLGITLTAVTLLFGGAGVANATAPSTAAPSATTTILADDNDNPPGKDSDKTGLWGLAGLLGLAGLAGLIRRKDRDVAPGAGPRGPAVPLGRKTEQPQLRAAPGQFFPALAGALIISFRGFSKEANQSWTQGPGLREHSSPLPP